MSIARTLTRPRVLIERLRLARADLRAAKAGVGELTRTVTHLTAKVDSVQAELAALAAATATDHERALYALRIVRDGDAAARTALWELRASVDYERAYEEDEPLITIIISTHRNWPLLRDRALPSVLAQTYQRWEAIVIGDAAPDDARRVVESFGDKRLRFVNLPYRGPYPPGRRAAGLVSGTTTWNTGLALARGSWIASNGDDDALRPGCIESLLAHARERRAEVSYGYIHQCEPDSPGTRLGVFPPVLGHWNLQASLLHGGLQFMSMQPTDWVFDVPNDWSLAERMLRIGVRFSMLDQSVVDYYPSALWAGQEPGRAD